MMNEAMEKRKSRLRDVLCFTFGAALILLLTSLDQGNMVSVGAWLVPWFILQTASLVIPLILVRQNGWKKVPLDEKAGLFFGYLAACWLCALAFVFMVSDFLNITHFVLAIFGVGLAAGYWFYRHPQKQREDMFP